MTKAAFDGWLDGLADFAEKQYGPYDVLGEYIPSEEGTVPDHKETYRVVASRITHSDDGWTCSTQLPTFWVEASSETEATHKAMLVTSGGLDAIKSVESSVCVVRESDVAA